MINLIKQWRLIFASTMALLCMEQTGMTSGWISPVLAHLQGPNSPIPTTSDEGSWMATVMSLVGIFTTPVSALSIEHLGRKISILLTTIPFIVSWILIGFATSVNGLIIARGISGVGIAFALSVVPIYLGEIAPADLRGAISLFMSVFVNIGILKMYWLASYPNLWISSGSAIFPLVFVLLFYFWLPESPYFLMKKNKKDEAIEVMRKFRNTENVDADIKNIESIVSENRNVNMFKEFVSTRCHIKALIVCLGVISIAQYTGGVTVILYEHLIFQRAGEISMDTLSLIQAVLQLLSSIGASFVVDRLGRKPLLIVSCIGSSFFMFCEGIYFYLHDNGYNIDSIWWLPLFAMVMFNISQVIGLTPISVAFFGELFHPKVKILSVCISKAYMSTSIVIVGKLFQILTDAFGNCVPFFVFSVVGFLGFFFVILVVPETKGRSLEDIQCYFKHKKFRK